MQTTTHKRSRDFSCCKVRLTDKFNASVCYKGPHEWFCKIIPQLREQYNLPQYQWEYLRGYLDAKIESLYHTKIAFGFMFNGQVVKQDWNNLTEEQKDYCRKDFQADSQSFYWLDKDGNITSKKF